jgi:hypothetical protein
MSFKSKMLAGAATLALVGGVGTAGALSASAATPSCGPTCIDIFSRDFGTFASPNFVLDVFRQGARVGQPIILFKQSNSDPAEDFTPSFQGLTSDFFAAGLVSSAVNLHYGGGGHFATTSKVCPDGTKNTTGICVTPDDPAVELEYAPFGVDSGLCVGVAMTAAQGEGVTLQPCGVSAKTVWILDVGGTRLSGADDINAASQGYIPLINGSDTNFSHPFVLTYPKNGFPTDRPRPQLRTNNLTGFSNGNGGPVLGSVSSNQLYGAVFGVLN